MKSLPAFVTLVSLFATSAVLSHAAPAAAPAETPRARIERMLSAMGGRHAWVGITFVHIQATHHEVSVRDPFHNQIWNDFSSARVRIEAQIEGITRRRAIEGQKGWRQHQGPSTPLTAAQFAAEHAWWESNIYRTLHRLAVNDPKLAARSVGENRLEIFTADGTRLNWFVLNQRGEPIRFGTFNDETGSVFGPLVGHTSGLKYPRWGSTADGAFRYEIVKFEPAARAPDTVSFTAP